MNKLSTILRWIGNSFLLIGYCILLYNNIKIGLIIKFIGGLLLLPSFYRYKMWDAIVIEAFFAVLEGTKLLQLCFLK